MVEVISNLINRLNYVYANTLEGFFANNPVLFGVLFLAVILALASLFIWVFFSSTAKRNLLELNLRQYNVSKHPLKYKFFAIILYLLEYVIIIPFIIILWFVGFSLVLLVLAKERFLIDVLLISASVIGAIRILAYFSEDVSKELAKLFPFISLSVLLLSSGRSSFEGIWRKILEIPSSINLIINFVVAIFVIEIILRVFYTIYEFWLSEEEASKTYIERW
ncbi:hypothetical protein HYV50_04695 [Candidatus Pacearchaeota archaeon]|nr:hypothetical protein [Candidatus Pacearchaeota archaeon]